MKLSALYTSIFIGLIGFSTLLGAFTPNRKPPLSHQQPNILFIMADDLGKEWISAYGAEDILTPNIDSLAEGGMKFNNVYSMPQCTPSRVALLTGTYPWRNGWVNHWDVPRWGVAYFDWKKESNMTFVRLLSQIGYKSAAAGKWQINDFRIEAEAMKKHGFDDWAMWTGYETNNPPSAERYADPYIHTKAGSKTYAGAFGPDIYTDFLIDFIKRHKDEPMFLYFPMALPHTPFVSTPDEPYAATKLEMHKAMVRYVDKCVGRLVETLDGLGLRERTIIIFTTDNGTTGRIRGRRNGITVEGAKAKKVEAGVCAPFVVNAPGMVPAGVESNALIDFTDLLPTFVDLAGGELPDDLTIDGVSVAPVFLGKKKDSEREWIMAMGHGRAKLDAEGVRGVNTFASRVIRDEQFKVWVSEEREITALYDLMADPMEENNLIGSKEASHQSALKEFREVVTSMPEKDARPDYSPRAANPWDRKH